MTTEKDIAMARTQFIEATTKLFAATGEFDAGLLRSVPYSRLREEHLAAALQAVAATHGVSLQLPLQIDSNGEFSIVALPEGTTSAHIGCGKYGSFAAVLNPYRPRCGAIGFPPAQLDENAGWCRLFHFEAEKLVLAQYEELEKTHSELFAQPA